MDTAIERIGGTLILIVSGRVDADSAESLAVWAAGQIGDADEAVILDFENVRYCSSAGLGAVMRLAKTMERRNGGFAVCTLAEAVFEVFRLTGFDRIMQVHDSRAAALAALNAGGRP